MAATKQSIKITKLENNTGQIDGLPKNPRYIRKGRFAALVKSITDAPEMLDLRELIVYPRGRGKYVVIGGNMRLKACRELGYEEMPCKVLPVDTPVAKLREYAIKDNNGFGEYDYGDGTYAQNKWIKDNGLERINMFRPGRKLIVMNAKQALRSASKHIEELEDWGLELPTDWYKDEDDPEEDVDVDEDEDLDDGEEVDKTEFYRSMFGDVLYDSDNVYEIPNLLLEQQAGHLELPFTPWGANSRLRKDVTTYHFYVDDYRFEKLFKDPINLLTSGCKAIVEPNCSLHDQTPLAFGLSQIYRKRWLSRYMQECGVKVYVDLNVSHKFIEYNKMGVPKGYNAFMTRGLIGWMDSLKSDLQVAQEISGLEKPNLIVYGGGDEIKAFCREHGLLYVTDFINAKKED